MHTPQCSRPKESPRLFLALAEAQQWVRASRSWVIAFGLWIGLASLGRPATAAEADLQRKARLLSVQALRARQNVLDNVSYVRDRLHEIVARHEPDPALRAREQQRIADGCRVVGEAFAHELQQVADRYCVMAHSAEPLRQTQVGVPIEDAGRTIIKPIRVLHYAKDRMRMGIYGCAFDPNVQSQNMNSLCMLGQNVADHLVLVPEGIDQRRDPLMEMTQAWRHDLVRQVVRHHGLEAFITVSNVARGSAKSCEANFLVIADQNRGIPVDWVYGVGRDHMSKWTKSWQGEIVPDSLEKFVRILEARDAHERPGLDPDYHGLFAAVFDREVPNLDHELLRRGQQPEREAGRPYLLLNWMENPINGSLKDLGIQTQATMIRRGMRSIVRPDPTATEEELRNARASLVLATSSLMRRIVAGEHTPYTHTDEWQQK